MKDCVCCDRNASRLIFGAHYPQQIILIGRLVKIIDEEQGMICADQCRDIYEEALLLYLDRLSPMISDMRDYFEAGDYERVRSLSHALCGMSATVGATVLQTLAKDMERAVLEHEIDSLIERFKRIEASVEQTQQAVLNLLSKVQPSDALVDSLLQNNQ